MDFFQYARQGRRHDVVFSAGFVEHFAELQEVVAQLCSLTREFVVTSVPNLLGVSGMLCRMIRPELYYAHRPINVAELRSVHEACGLETLFCNFVDGVKLSIQVPAALGRYRLLTLAIRCPAKVVNVVSEKLSRTLGHWPGTRLFSPAILYVGRRWSSPARRGAAGSIAPGSAHRDPFRAPGRGGRDTDG